MSSVKINKVRPGYAQGYQGLSKGRFVVTDFELKKMEKENAGSNKYKKQQKEN